LTVPAVTPRSLFGNNSRTPVRDGFVSRADVYRLVQDDRLDLPRPPSR
jgi:hypothetical protein